MTAVAVARDGSIYAAAVGTKQPAPVVAPHARPPAPAPTATVHGERSGAPAPPQPRAGRAATGIRRDRGGVSGGSEVYRIEPNGNPRRIWSNAQDVVYAIAFDSSGHAAAGRGQ